MPIENSMQLDRSNPAWLSLPLRRWSAGQSVILQMVIVVVMGMSGVLARPPGCVLKVPRKLKKTVKGHVYDPRHMIDGGLCRSCWPISYGGCDARDFMLTMTGCWMHS
jgi:hypothetical protein